MLLRSKNLQKKKFTLIELIIVIVVMGILSGMALPKFLGISNNASVAALQNDLGTVETAIEIYKITNSDLEDILESEQYFKNNSIPKTLSDSLLLIGDTGSDIRKIEMDKLEPYIERLKYSDTEYLYSMESGTVIDPIGKIDGNEITHHILDGNSTSTENSQEGEIPDKKFNFKNGENRFIEYKYGFALTNLNNLYAFDREGEKIYSITLENNEKVKHFDTYYDFEATVLTDSNNIYYIGHQADYYAEKLNFPAKNYTKVIEHQEVYSAITEDGEVYVMGNNAYYLVDKNERPESFINEAVLLEFPERIKDVILQDELSIAISESNKIYFWGENNVLLNDKYGETFAETKTPVLFFEDENISIKKVYSIQDALILLNDKNEYYYYGRAKNMPIIVSDKDSYTKEETYLLKLDVLDGIVAKEIHDGIGYFKVITEDKFLYSNRELGATLNEFNISLNGIEAIFAKSYSFLTSFYFKDGSVINTNVYDYSKENGETIDYIERHYDLYERWVE